MMTQTVEKPRPSPQAELEDAREIDWQFDADDLDEVERWLASAEAESHFRIAPSSREELVDTYFDTEDWRLYRAGYALRTRKGGDRSEATMKALGTEGRAARERRELTEPLDGEGAEALRATPGGVGSRVRALVGDRPLLPLFEVRTARRILGLHTDDTLVGEVALDETLLPVEGRDEPVRLRRVEVEFKTDDRARLDEFVDELRDDCALTPVGVSKFESGVAANGLKPDGLPDLGSTHIDDSLTLGEVAFAVLRRQFGAFLANEAPARIGEDPEGVHDIRVASRRLRAAMSLFEHALPARTPRLREEFQWIATTLGEVRDLDVQMEQLDKWMEEAEEQDREGLEALKAALRRRREAARGRMLEAMESPRYERLVSTFSTLLQRGPLRRSPDADKPAVAVAPDLVTERYRKVRKLGDSIGPDSPAEEYHRLRIRGKRLRYALEFFTEVYGKPVRSVIRPLVAMQDVLGQHQDAVVAQQHLRELAEQETELPPTAIFAMGGIAHRYAGQAAELRRRFPKAYRDIKGKPWKNLLHVMQEHRARVPQEALAPEPAAQATGS
jgi:CHAD domain-containing protein